MAAFQVVIGFGGMQDFTAAGVNHHQLTGADTAFFDNFIGLIIPDTDFRSAGDEFIFGDDIARRAQAITVKITGGVAAI
ncbi:Uncharacterised protein [Yersinia enterocolitica]|nr:Uncharacterised protein [Yersinia enterocolitica]